MLAHFIPNTGNKDKQFTFFLRKRHKFYRGIGGTGSEVLGSRASRFIPRKKLQVPSEQNTVWVPEIFLCEGEEKGPG
jgi:hypothetical protein